MILIKSLFSTSIAASACVYAYANSCADSSVALYLSPDSQLMPSTSIVTYRDTVLWNSDRSKKIALGRQTMNVYRNDIALKDKLRVKEKLKIDYNDDNDDDDDDNADIK